LPGRAEEPQGKVLLLIADALLVDPDRGAAPANRGITPPRARAALV
jgi:hypothetical protein